jgi:hypothetical protein
MIRLCSLLLLLCGLNIAADAQERRGDEDRWEQLGRTYVDGRRDHDRVVVNNRANYRALVLEVRGGPIEFNRVVVHFDNGADHELEIRDRIPAGSRTRVIDLPGDRRRIRSVEFWYSPDRWRSRPYVNLLGQRGRGGEPDSGRWEILGQANVDGRVDHDRIVVNNPGSFRALQLGIRNGTIEFQRVVVHFENGEDQELQIRQRITAPGKTRVIDLPGNRRRIQSAEFWYSKADWRSRPLVNLWGLR